MDAFNSDVLIYASIEGHALGQRVRALLSSAPTPGLSTVGTGSVLLLPEILSKPLRDRRPDEIRDLTTILGRLDLWPVDQQTATLAISFCSRYRLRPNQATHLACAVHHGADRFLTANHKDFPKTICEIEIVYPSDLPPAH